MTEHTTDLVLHVNAAPRRLRVDTRVALNAVFHPTGRRVRSLPITIEQLL
jgi:hypothetical protein